MHSAILFVLSVLLVPPHAFYSSSCSDAFPWLHHVTHLSLLVFVYFLCFCEYFIFLSVSFKLSEFSLVRFLFVALWGHTCLYQVPLFPSPPSVPLWSLRSFTFVCLRA